MCRPSSLLPLALCLALAGACSQKPHSDSVLLISLDTTRADHVDSGRGSRAWTPELKRFAAGAWVFDNAYTTIPQTLPAHLGVLSGRLPHELGVFGNEYVYDGRWPMLQQVLQRRGWQTAGVVSLGTLAAATGIARGFDHFEDRLHDGSHFYASAEKVTEAAISRLQRFKKSRFFLFAHYSDPHPPYAPPQAEAPFVIELDGRRLMTFNAYAGTIARLRLELPPGVHRLELRMEAPARDFEFFIIRRLQAGPGAELSLEGLDYSKAHYGGSHLLRRERGSVVIRSRRACELRLFQVIPILTRRAALENYRREVEFLDRQVGRLLRALENSPAAGRTAVVMFADHGEGLGEREGYFGHVRFLNRQFIRVPLFVRFPGEAPRRIEAPVSLQAIPSWLGDALAVEGSRIPRSGPPLAELRRGHAGTEPVRAFTFTPAAGSDRCSLILWPFQMIVSRDPRTGDESREYYDLRLAAERRMDAISPGLIARQAPASWRRFESSRPLWQGAFARRGKPSAGERQVEKLKTLGYIDPP